jgi:hypothetical protein
MLLLAGLVTLTLAAAPSLAVVGGITDLTEFSNPASPYYGMNLNYVYAPKASSVAIGYFTMLTADHYSINVVGDTFQVGTDWFRIAGTETVKNPDNTTADLRVLHLENLINKYRPLPGFYELYTGTFSTTTEKNCVIVGYGDSGVTSDKWYTDTPNTYGVRRWGTNRYDSTPANLYQYTTHSTRCFKMVYSKLDGLATVHESGVGLLDSGGGVFVNDNGTWKLAGINLYREPVSGPYTQNYPASIPAYAASLSTILQTPPGLGATWLANLLPGDLDGNGRVDLVDYMTLKADYGKTVLPWKQGDCNGDGRIGYDELLAVETNLGYDLSLAMGSLSGGGAMPIGGVEAAPEPGSVLLLALGAAAMLRRRAGQSKKRIRASATVFPQFRGADPVGAG